MIRRSCRLSQRALALGKSTHQHKHAMLAKQTLTGIEAVAALGCTPSTMETKPERFENAETLPKAMKPNSERLETAITLLPWHHRQEMLRTGRMSGTVSDSLRGTTRGNGKHKSIESEAVSALAARTEVPKPSTRKRGRATGARSLGRGPGATFQIRLRCANLRQSTLSPDRA